MNAIEQKMQKETRVAFSHTTVLLHEAVDALDIKPDGVYLDGTAGGGGHSAAIARRLSSGRLIALDKDPAALAVLRERLAGLPAQVIQSDFRDIPAVLDRLRIPAADGVLLDLGVSSHQIDTAQRGFSYHREGRLDMRMSGEGLSAYDIVNTWDPRDIARILWTYGEERFSRQIARAVERAREAEPVETTTQLAQIIRDAIPAPARRTGGNPAKRSFQALRIAVNGELDALNACLSTAFERLRTGGRFAVITFHSLEDRMVKQRFAEWCRGCTCPPSFPVCVCGKTPRARAVARKPILPSEEELAANPRAHSAKLRVVERLPAPDQENGGASG